MFKFVATAALLLGPLQVLAQNPAPVTWLTCQSSAPQGGLFVVGSNGTNAYRNYDGVVSPLVSRTQGNLVENVQVSTSSVIWTLSSDPTAATFVRTFDFPNRRLLEQTSNPVSPNQTYRSECQVAR